jgi:hypothetical protein
MTEYARAVLVRWWRRPLSRIFLIVCASTVVLVVVRHSVSIAEHGFDRWLAVRYSRPELSALVVVVFLLTASLVALIGYCARATYRRLRTWRDVRTIKRESRGGSPLRPTSRD